MFLVVYQDTAVIYNNGLPIEGHYYKDALQKHRSNRLLTW